MPLIYTNVKKTFEILRSEKTFLMDLYVLLLTFYLILYVVLCTFTKKYFLLHN